jgi:hypothetical protein
MGLEWPLPGMAAFHLMFLSGAHSSGRFLSVEMPRLAGPRHCGQFEGSAAAPAADSETASAENRQMTRAVLVRIASFTVRFPRAVS